MFVVFFEGNTIGNLEDTLAESAEELRLCERGRLLFGEPQHEVSEFLGVFGSQQPVSIALVGELSHMCMQTIVALNE